jgi:error-prone DNA polymerase
MASGKALTLRSGHQAASRRTQGDRPRQGARLALRLGFRQIKGFGQDDAERLVDRRGSGYPDAQTLWQRSGLDRRALERLAAADALRSLEQEKGGLDRRQGLWALKALGEAPLPLFAAASKSNTVIPGSLAPREPRNDGETRNDGEKSEARAAALLPEMPLGEHVVEDYKSLSLSLKRHPLAFLRRELAQEGLVTADALATLPVERRIATAGLVLIRQRPGSAKGVIFITIEDETGIANLIVWPPILERFRRTVLGATLLYCRGRLQREAGVIHIVAEDLRDLTPRLNTLRERSGAEPDERKPPLRLPERIPGRIPGRLPGHGAREIYDPDIVVPSRNFR